MIKIRYCKDCKNICKPSGAIYEPHPESICISPGAIRPNFVTGEIGADQCKNINRGGKCKLFEQKNNDRFIDNDRIQGMGNKSPEGVLKYKKT